MTLPVIFKLATQIAAKGAKSFRHPSDPLKLGPARGTRGWTSPSEPTGLSKLYEAEKLGLTPPHEYRRMAAVDEVVDVDEVILDAPLSRSERDYFANLPRTGSGFFEKKLTAKDVEFFDEMIREGDPYDFMAEIPSAKIRTDKKGNKYLRVQGEEDMNNLFKFIMDGPEGSYWDKGDLPPSLRRWDWDRSFKDVKEFKHGGGLSSINKPININGQPHNLAWINSDEASVLKAMGGSGKKVDGIPAYFYSEEDFMIGGPELSEALGYPEEDTYSSMADPSLSEYTGTEEITSGMGDRERIAREVDEAQGAVRGLHPSERRDRKISRDALRTTLEESLPTLERQRGPQELSQAYPWWAPFALPIKALGGIAGWLRGNTAPVIATVMVEGERMNLHEDGTLSEIRAGDQTTEDADLYKKDKPIEVAKGIPEPTTTTAKGPMQTYQEGLTSIESNQGLINSFRILKGQYPHLSAEEILKMLGKDINEIDISEFDINE